MHIEIFNIELKRFSLQEIASNIHPKRFIGLAQVVRNRKNVCVRRNTVI